MVNGDARNSSCLAADGTSAWVDVPWTAKPAGAFRLVFLLSLLLVVSAAAFAQTQPVWADKPNEITFPAVETRFVRLALYVSDGAPCIDELEVYDAAGKVNLALASAGAKASAAIAAASAMRAR